MLLPHHVLQFVEGGEFVSEYLHPVYGVVVDAVLAVVVCPFSSKGKTKSNPTIRPISVFK